MKAPTIVTIGDTDFVLAFSFGERVFHKAREDRIIGIVTDIQFGADGGVLYSVNWGNDSTSQCYACELTTEFTRTYQT